MQEHLMIDGNNAIHAIPELLEELVVDRNQARDSLVRMLEPVTNTGARLTVVFDGRWAKFDSKVWIFQPIRCGLFILPGRSGWCD